MTLKIALLLAQGFEEAEALVPTDVFRRVGLQVDLISLDNTEIVTSAHNVKVVTDRLLQQTDLNHYDMLFLPGGHESLDSKYSKLNSIYQQFIAENKRIAAICAAPTSLAKLGLLTDKNAVCYPTMRQIFTENQVHYHHIPAVVDAPFITGRGPGAAFDFALTIVSELLGIEAAEQVKQQLFY